MTEIIVTNYSKIIKLKDQNIIYKKENNYEKCLITIGIPTYQRNTLERALISVSKQLLKDMSYNLYNAGYSIDTLKVVKKYSNKIPSIFLIAQENNIGAIKNLSFLLNCAKTKYFMWLADDDEISKNYLETLFEDIRKRTKSSYRYDLGKKCPIHLKE